MRQPGAVRVVVAATVVALAVALWAPAARAGQATQTVNGGSLDFTAANVTLPSATLTGANLTVSGAPGAEWIAKDARGTGAAWSVTVSAGGNLTSAAGSVETIARTIAISNLSLIPGTVTPKPGSDPTTNLTASTITLSTSAQTLLSCSSVCKGRYGFTPTLQLAVPASAYRSNYSGTINASSLNPYTVTLTFTIS